MDYLVKNASAIACAQSNVSDIRIRNGKIAELGNHLLAEQGEKVIDAQGCVIYPGLVNTHHHLAQSILKGIPEGLNQGLGEWLASVPYRYWPQITPQMMYHAARLGFYELVRSGTTTCADHHYLYHANSSKEMEEAVWQAAEDMGIRFVLCRGGATVKGSHKGLAKAGVIPESTELMLERLERTRSRYHQEGGDAMRKLVVAPTTIAHSATPDDLKLLAEYARSHKLRMHSHLLEVGFDNEQTLAKYGKTAVDFAESCDWLGDDVWFAHIVQATEQDIKILAETKTGIAHCPTSNCRLGSGIAPIIEMEKAGMPISIGVDGSASSESGSMIQELNLTWLIHRAQHGPSATNAEQVLKWGAQGGASILGLDQVGQIEVGFAADLVIYDIHKPRFSGVHSPLMAPLLCGEPVEIKTSFINGRIVFQQSDSDIYHSLVEDVQHSVEELIGRVQYLERA